MRNIFSFIIILTFFSIFFLFTACVTSTPATEKETKTANLEDDLETEDNNEIFFGYEKEYTQRFTIEGQDEEVILTPADFFQDKSETSNHQVILAPQVEPEMLTPEYWLAKTTSPYKVMMSQQEIAKWNEEVLESRFSPTEYYRIVTDIRKYGRRFNTQQIRDEMLRYRPGVIWYKKNLSADGTKSTIHRLTREDWLTFYDKMNYEPLGTKEYYAYTTAYRYPQNLDYYPVRKGICIKRSTIRNIPDETFYSDDPSFWYDDVNQISGILMNEPVLILWESKDKNWYLIQTYYSAGWIHKSDIALCTDEEFAKYFDYAKKDKNDFVTITEDQFLLQGDCVIEKTGSNVVLFMGTYLHTADWDSINLTEQFKERIPHSSYLVEIPYKKDDETLGTKLAAIPAGVCCKGLMPYTQANIINLAFKSLGKRYGWGGMENERDCTGYTKDLYRCFGFNFGKNSAAQAAMPGKTIYMNKLSDTQKKAVLDELPVGTLLYYYGHVFIYLGKDDGQNASNADNKIINGSEYYVISSMGTYYADGQTVTAKVNACSVSVNNLTLVKKDGRTWFDSLVCAKLFQL